MHATWRWFGPKDQVMLDEVSQAGARGIVTALHHIPTGGVWTVEEIEARQESIISQSSSFEHPLRWDVVESLSVSEDIKRQSGDWRGHVEAYKQSLSNLATAGINVICYNFMPLIDWTRTDLNYSLPNKSTCMRFDLIDFVVFDVHLLQRENAADDFAGELKEKALRRFQSMTDARKSELIENIVCGLPGAAETFSIDDIRQSLDTYKSICSDRLRQNQTDFLEMVAPHAQALGLRLCCHPDDPPYSLLGLPRIMSTEQDYASLVEAVDVPSNGITLCSGSLSARSDNDLPRMMRRLGPHVHFLHLRNVQREHDDLFGSFHESEHLKGAVDMPALIAAVLDEEAHRRDSGRADHCIPFRPDHGQNVLDDLTRHAQPGYPAIGRLKGLAELHGVIAGLSHHR